MTPSFLFDPLSSVDAPQVQTLKRGVQNNIRLISCVHQGPYGALLKLYTQAHTKANSNTHAGRSAVRKRQGSRINKNTRALTACHMLKHSKDKGDVPGAELSSVSCSTTPVGLLLSFLSIDH